jgi:hypothetical protein
VCRAQPVFEHRKHLPSNLRRPVRSSLKIARRAGQGVIAVNCLLPERWQETCPAYSIEVVHCVLSARETGVIDARRRVEKRRGRERDQRLGPRSLRDLPCEGAYIRACSLDRQATTGLYIQVPCVAYIFASALCHANSRDLPDRQRGARAMARGRAGAKVYDYCNRDTFQCKSREKTTPSRHDGIVTFVSARACSQGEQGYGDRAE